MDLSPLNLDDHQLAEVRDTLIGRIERGLGAAGTEIKCLPAHLPVPPELEGEAIVVDTGGTNMRAALVRVAGTDAQIVRGPIKERLPVRDGQTIEKDAFFDAQAALVERLEAPKDLPVGYCFSYPSNVLPSRDARLIRWTKSIDVPGVEGELVGEALAQALRRRGQAPPRLPVLNDTVASMLGGATRQSGTQRGRMIGLIAGTGSNMASFFDGMAVNLESGNYHPPFLTRWDDAVDLSADDPGSQRFEKAIAGFYLPYLFAEILPDFPGFSPNKGSAQLVELRNSSGPAAEVAGAILGRAADMIAAGLAAVASFADGKVIVVAEGSLYWGDPQMNPRCRATLERLAPGKTELFRLEDANLIGSACAALME